MPVSLQTTIELLDVQDVCDVLEVSRQRVHQLASRDDFPPPLGELNGGRVWSHRDIVLWNANSGRGRGEQPTRADQADLVLEHGNRPVPAVLPARDPNRPQNDPWDVDACRYILRRLHEDGRVGRWNSDGLLIAGREQPTARPELVEQAIEVFKRYGVERRRDPGRNVIHFFRTDPDAPTHPVSAAERRAWRRQTR
jgi:predicted DNA-binding transcriptional regulator AlpA